MPIKEFWGARLPHALLKELEEYASSIGTIRIEARVRASNNRAQQFFNSFGYEIEGIRKGATVIDGKMVDEIYIGKLFNL